MYEERIGLADERGFLLASLEDLERERAAGDLTEADYLALRTSYERRVVDVLSTLADGSVSEEGAPAAGSPRRREGSERRRWARRALSVAAVAAVALGTGFMVDGSAGNRLPTQAITGSLPPAIGNELIDAQDALVQGNELQALKLFQAVLNAQSDEPEALAYWGWIVASSGAASGNKSLLARGIASMEAAVRADPTYSSTYLLLGLTHLASGDPKAAVAELRHFLALGPPAADARAAKAALAKAEKEAASSSRHGSPASGPGAAPTPTAVP